MKIKKLALLAIALTSCGNVQHPESYSSVYVQNININSFPTIGEQLTLPNLENIFKNNIFSQAIMLPCNDSSFFKNTGAGVRFYSNSEDAVIGTSNYIRADISIPKFNSDDLKPYPGSKDLPVPFWYVGGEGAGDKGWPLDLGLGYKGGEVIVYGQTNNGKPIILDTKIHNPKITRTDYQGDVYSFPSGNKITIEMYINQDNKVIFNIYAAKANVYSKYTIGTANKRVVLGNSNPDSKTPIMSLSYPKDDGKDGNYENQQPVSIKDWGWKSNVAGHLPPDVGQGQPLKYNVTIAYNGITESNFFQNRDDRMPDSESKILVGHVTNWDKGKPQSISYFSNWSMGKNPNIFCQTKGVYGWTLPDKEHTKLINIYMPKALKPCWTPRGYPLNDNLPRVFISQALGSTVTGSCSAPPLPEITQPADISIMAQVGSTASGNFVFSNSGPLTSTLNYTITAPNLTSVNPSAGTLAGSSSQTVTVTKLCTSAADSGTYPVTIADTDPTSGVAGKTMNVTVECKQSTVHLSDPPSDTQSFGNPLNSNVNITVSPSGKPITVHITTSSNVTVTPSTMTFDLPTTTSFNLQKDCSNETGEFDDLVTVTMTTDDINTPSQTKTFHFKCYEKYVKVYIGKTIALNKKPSAGECYSPYGDNCENTTYGIDGGVISQNNSSYLGNCYTFNALSQSVYFYFLSKSDPKYSEMAKNYQGFGADCNYTQADNGEQVYNHYAYFLKTDMVNSGMTGTK